MKIEIKFFFIVVLLYCNIQLSLDKKVRDKTSFLKKREGKNLVAHTDVKSELMRFGELTRIRNGDSVDGVPFGR